MIQARKLRELRGAAGFTLRQMAELLDEDEPALAALESADAPLDPELLDRCARAFGMTVERLLSDDAVKAPALVLFRSLNPEVISELRARRAHFGLGDFLRSTWDLAELAALRARKGDEPWTPPDELEGALQRVPDSDPELYRQAESLADQIRDRLDLGDAAVPSMTVYPTQVGWVDDTARESWPITALALVTCRQSPSEFHTRADSR